MAKNEKTPQRELDKLAQEQRQQMEQFQRQQEQVQKELGDLIKEDKEALKDVMEEQKAQAQQLAQEAKQMAKIIMASKKDNGQFEFRTKMVETSQVQDELKAARIPHPDP